MAQVKPFSFTLRENHTHNPKVKEALTLALNNTKPINIGKSKSHHKNLKTHVNHFKAHPVPPRTRALLSDLKPKEQQEYREIKKKLRSEALLKSAALPPWL